MKNSDNKNDISRLDVDTDIEEIGKDIVVGRQETRYEDGRNVISIIINAISVRINMPRGTVKALMACLMVLVIVGLIYAANVFHSWSRDRAAEKQAAETVEQTEEDTAEAEMSEEIDKTPANDDVIALKDYVNISPHYYYHLPDNVKAVWSPDDMYVGNETFCDFLYEGEQYTARSYILDYADEDLADTIKRELSYFDDTEIIDDEYIDGKYGEILKVRFETSDEEGIRLVVTGFYWYESSPLICCLEVASEEWHDGTAEDMIKDSVYRVSAGSTEPYMVDEDAWAREQNEDAMNSMAEDAMREYYEPYHDPNDDRVLKP